MMTEWRNFKWKGVDYNIKAS